MRKPLLCVVALVSFCFQAASQTLFDPSSPAKVHMVVWRGCEEACRSFIRYFKDRDLPDEVAVTDVARDRDQLVNVEYQLKSEAPDLVVTWGTSVTRAILGTRADYGAESALGDEPALFMSFTAYLLM